MTKPRLVFISQCAAPHMVKLSYALQEYYDAEFWFYENVTSERAAFWEVELGERCRVLDPVYHWDKGILARRYVAPRMAKDLETFDPDIVMLGGFSVPANYQAYRWAKARGRKTVMFTERSRTPGGELHKWGPIGRGLRFMYRDVDLVMTTAEDAVTQFRDELRFGDRVVAARYAADLDAYFAHELRRSKPGYTYLFANRMTEIYNPIGALEIFAEVRSRHPDSRLLMNAVGELDAQCKRRIEELEIEDAVEFLTEISSWGELHRVYERSDILLFPATFSNGNFTILEAMASGMGIVISDRIMGIGNLIDDGVNGYRCPPTKEAFLERLQRYIDDPSLFTTHAERNRVIAEPLSMSGTAALIAQLLEERLVA